MEFILDTNIYRNLVRAVSFDKIIELSEKIKTREKELSCTSTLSLVVSMELIKHLLPEDPAKEECYKALCLQSLHTSKIDLQNNLVSGNFSPPLNELLVDYFFQKKSKKFPLYQKVLELILELTKNEDINNCQKNEEWVKTIGEQILFEKKEAQNNIAEFLKSLNNGKLDWTFFNKIKSLRRIFFKRMHSKKEIELLACSLLNRTYQIMDIKEIQAEILLKKDDLIKLYRPAFEMILNLLTHIAHGHEKVSDLSDELWNTYHDFEIIFAACHGSNGKSKKLVTEEKAIRNAFKEAGKEEMVFCLNEYKNFLRI